MSTCNSCHRPVLWVVIDKSGQRMPLDFRPVADGTIKLLASNDPETGAPIAHVMNAKENVETSASVKRYVSHFATCPNASRHRRR